MLSKSQIARTPEGEKQPGCRDLIGLDSRASRETTAAQANNGSLRAVGLPKRYPVIFANALSGSRSGPDSLVEPLFSLLGGRGVSGEGTW